jgi:hypothetical protein
VTKEHDEELPGDTESAPKRKRATINTKYEKNPNHLDVSKKDSTFALAFQKKVKD